MKYYTQKAKDIARKIIPYIIAGTMALSTRAGDELSSKVYDSDNFVGGSVAEIEDNLWSRNSKGEWTSDSEEYENTMMNDSQIKDRLNKPKYNLFILK